MADGEYGPDDFGGEDFPSEISEETKRVIDETLARPRRVSKEGSEGTEIATGTWWWIRIFEENSPKGAMRLACLTHLGSNYAKFETAGDRNWTVRVHLDHFAERDLRPEPDAPAIIAREIDTRRRHTFRLMEEVKALTARLALNPGTSETEALVMSTGSTPVAEYKTALIKAKETTLPNLFKEIKSTNEAMGAWMKAELLPLEALVDGIKPEIKKIESRIFNVELYAGLIEQVAQISDGKPAAREEPVHLYQRRAYMDEECLIDYTHGGMEFNNLSEFDAWIAKPEHRNRILPHERSVIAFRVRRNEKDRSDMPLHKYIRLLFDGAAERDKWTYLYLRNGEQMYRLRTGIEFGYQLFPDVERSRLDGHVLWAHIDRHYRTVKDLITEDDYHARKDAWQRRRAAYLKKENEWKLQVADLKAKGITHDSKEWPNDVSYFGPSWWDDDDKIQKEYERWSPESVYYDDIAAYVAAQVDQHNRLVLVLQGLLDRSPVFQPHPPIKLWDPNDFATAISLVYDDSRALAPSDLPNFEEYREALNLSLRVGSATVGQDDYWQEKEAEKENERQARRARDRNYDTRTRYRPHGNPGPGQIARVVSKSAGHCTFTWTRKRTNARYYNDQVIADKVVVPNNRIMNADAYTPGDYKIFFNDPRTRAQYLKWAPFLLEAEEYHANRREISPISHR